MLKQNLKDENEVKKVYFNKKQVDFMVGQCRDTYAFCGRGFGKTNKITANRVHTNFVEMPRSLNLIGCKTYKSVIFNIIPGIIKTFEQYGYVEGKDYWVGKQPPRPKVDSPIYRIPEYDRAMSFMNGAVGLFGSVDRGFYNSLSFDSGIFEETRKLKKENIDEILPAIRGNKDMPWSNKWCHLSKLFVTDRPKLTSERWIYDIIKQSPEDPEIIRWLFIITRKIYEYEETLLTETNQSVRARIRYKIAALNKDLNELRKKTIYVFEASTFDNAEILGIDSIKQLRQSLTEKEFLRAVENEDILGDETSFYFLLSSEHEYTAVDYHLYDTGKVDIRNPSADCRWDNDIDHTAPLIIGCDWGRFNCLNVGQHDDDGYRFINAMYVEPPELTSDLAVKFNEYYRFLPNKHVHIHFDQTAIAQDGKGLPYIRQFVDKLRSLGWEVDEFYQGGAPLHENKYELWQILLKAKRSNGQPFMQFNHYNCEDMLISMQGARTKVHGNSFKKDKSDERNNSLNQAHTTHLSDSGDQVVWGLFRHMLPDRNTPSFVPTNI